jgi:hypothetical protein
MRQIVGAALFKTEGKMNEIQKTRETGRTVLGTLTLAIAAALAASCGAEGDPDPDVESQEGNLKNADGKAAPGGGKAAARRVGLISTNFRDLLSGTGTFPDDPLSWPKDPHVSPTPPAATPALTVTLDGCQLTADGNGGSPYQSDGFAICSTSVGCRSGGNVRVSRGCCATAADPSGNTRSCSVCAVWRRGAWSECYVGSCGLVAAARPC